MSSHSAPVNEPAAQRAVIHHDDGCTQKLKAGRGLHRPADVGNKDNRINRLRLGLIAVLAIAALPCAGLAQASAANWAASASDRYLVYPDQSYGYFSGVSVKLDVWQAQTKEPVPTVIYYHGGGWFFGDRTGALPYLMPWLARGWNVINVEYRMSGTALAPAAVEDARCALRWVYRNAEHFHLDTSRIIVTGHSAGGHLALMAGMLQDSDGLDNNCPADAAMGDQPLKVAAVVDWYGPTDISDLIAGPDRKTYAVAWLGSLPDRDAVARRVSPLTYVRAGLPPILMIHGDSDPVVPYSQSQRLHTELDKVHVPNELYTVTHGSHGMFGAEADVEAYRQVWDFLQQYLPTHNEQ
jgi:acetyl esterase/lipase